MNKRPIRYLNTDLDLVASNDLDVLVAALDALGVSALHVTHGEDGLWRSTLETAEQHEEPEATIQAMLTAIETLDQTAHALWGTCTQREFNIGFDCGDGPWAFNQGLSNATLLRLAQSGATLRVTLYPAE